MAPETEPATEEHAQEAIARRHQKSVVASTRQPPLGQTGRTTPTHRRTWWLKKLEGNAARDKIHQRALRKLGWRVIVIWECQCDRSQSLLKLTRQMD